MLQDYFETYARDYQYYKGGAWCYEDGCLYRGLIALYEATGERPWLDHLIRLVSGQIDAQGRLVGYEIDEFNIDNILPGRALVFLHRLTGEPRWLDAAAPLARQLETHPRTGSNVYWHKLRYPHQIWLDGLYMALPFKVEYARAASDPQMVEEALRQFTTALDLTHDRQADLYRHGYDEARQQAWADAESGLSPAHWARSIGWLAMAFVDIIENLSVGAARRELTDRAAALASRIIALRTADHRWLQVIDRPDEAQNYPESSATAMFSYFLQKLARLGGPAGVSEAGRASLQSLVAQELRRDADGRLRLHNICCVAGLGGFNGRYRDGTVGYYLSEEIRADDIKGVGPMMMAYAETLLDTQSMMSQSAQPEGRVELTAALKR
ncbi:glycoside hydrolase family 88 protein [Neorhizobium sp. BETTINA12A]|uniref:glycoside hydrolase family 88/105 protein n=1 Tax=Neorhizobium sp. BETTINA12A TaxID=2908924 RepID=UPI001FF2403C|nr:glycoside hydrolase family 88 protein [Neorhizobium sp. BETTINA12A]MCJ9749710.1 glycoside hydrolase family 88 protein [Neorhizobium sp. BETTINA12A]